jgi:FAD/FMN-containing dehydrogenase
MCGHHGYTIQVSVPRREALEAITELITICQGAPCPPVTTIMRLHRRDDHTISFSEDGYSLNFEFHPKRRHAARMRPHVDALVDCVIRRGGRVHLAKDMILAREQFRRLYPEHTRFLQMKQRVDPLGLFASDAYRRLLLPAGALTGAAPSPHAFTTGVAPPVTADNEPAAAER